MYRGTVIDPTNSRAQDGIVEEESNLEDKSFNWNYGLMPIVILAACAVYISTITLIPYHDVFEFPSFWCWGMGILPQYIKAEINPQN